MRAAPKPTVMRLEKALDKGKAGRRTYRKRCFGESRYGKSSVGGGEGGVLGMSKSSSFHSVEDALRLLDPSSIGSILQTVPRRLSFSSCLLTSHGSKEVRRHHHLQGKMKRCPPGTNRNVLHRGTVSAYGARGVLRGKSERWTKRGPGVGARAALIKGRRGEDTGPLPCGLAVVNM